MNRIDQRGKKIGKEKNGYVYSHRPTHTPEENTITPTEREIDFVRTQGDQKTHYNWSLNVAELTHFLEHIHQPTDLTMPANTNPPATDLFAT